jgi:glycerol-3-phosphate acyltransferase PlsX
MSSIRLAIDVASGDLGSATLIAGVLEAMDRSADAFSACLCGDAGMVDELLASTGASLSSFGDRLSVEHCTEVVTPDDAPSRVWKRKANASIVRCVSLQKEGRVDASVSAGDTGVLMSAAVCLLGRVDGVSRPALGAVVPSTGQHPVLLLDVGANLNCRAEHLVSFGMLGYEYMSRLYGIESPRVALLNVGEEPLKGTQTIFEAARMLATKCPGWAGFIEGTRILSGDAHVIVCDGFVGNVLLKSYESYYTLTKSILGGKGDVLEMIRRNMTILDADNYGAVPILGIKGIVLKAHGGSSAKAIANAVLVTVAAVHHHRPAFELRIDSKGHGVSYAV